MRIGIIHFYNRSFPPEIRIQKHIPALIEVGHQICVLSQIISSNDVPFERVNKSYSIRRIKLKKQSLLSYFNLNRKEIVNGLKEFINDF